MTEHLEVFDTTLRDGTQGSKCKTMTLAQKVEIAQMLEDMRVDSIEAGYAASSNANFRSIQEIARTVKSSRVFSLARVNESEICAAAEAVRSAKKGGGIHIFYGSSPTHLKKLGITTEEMLEGTHWAVSLARGKCGEVEFSPEDAGRTSVAFLTTVIETAIKAGATTINVPDTVGYCMPAEYGKIIFTLRSSVKGADKVKWSVHCHDDLGCATANTLAGVLAGARQVECTINGIGERAGNAALEEVVMAVRTRNKSGAYFPCETRIDTRFCTPASKLVEKVTGFVVARNKAVVGDNAFAHESGIHQDGVIKVRESYEIMQSCETGWTGDRFTLGPQSGKKGLADALSQMGETLSEGELNRAFRLFKQEADERPVTRDILRTIVQAVRC